MQAISLFFLRKGEFMKQNLSRNISICARVDEEEREIIRQKMDCMGITNVNEYLRRMAIYGYMIEIDMQPLNELSVELSRIGNNLNQISRATHQKKDIYKEDVQAIKKEWGEVMEKLGVFLDKANEV